MVLLNKNKMKYKVKLVRLGKGYAIEVEAISVTDAYIQARQKLCFMKGFANDHTITNHSCVEMPQGQEMDWFFDMLKKSK